jgi:signal transduction histidine kinase
MIARRGGARFRLRAEPRLHLEGDAEGGRDQYGRAVYDGTPRESPQADLVRALFPAFALVVAVVAVVTDPSSAAADLLLAVPVVGAFAVWAYVPSAPLPAVVLAVLVPVVFAQRSGELEPLMFEVSLLAYVAGRWASSRAAAVALGLVLLAAPVTASLIQDPSELAAGIWVLGIAFPWVIGRAAARQRLLAAQLQATQRELAQQALLGERRRIARDVHDFVGHGLAAVMLQITSARHVLRRDPAAADEALRSAEEVGRRSMQELRRTVALLRSDDEAAAASPLPSAEEIPALVEDARVGGLAVRLRMRGDLSRIAPSVGVALYRITQEALANAARHAPDARTALGIEVGGGRASLIAETTGPTIPEPAGEPDRPRFGLLGMRERATALGGEFAAGPTADGWRVSCRLPLEAKDKSPAADVRAS